MLLDVADTAPLKVLHAVNGLERLVIDPRTVLPAIAVRSQRPIAVGCAGDDDTLLWLAVVIVQAGGEVTVNLRAPIVINPERMLGRQVMPNACVYPLHYVVSVPHRDAQCSSSPAGETRPS